MQCYRSQPSLEPLAKNSTGTIKPRLDGLRGASLDRRDLVIGHVLVFEEDQGFAKVGWQVGNGIADGLGPFILFEKRPWIGVGGRKDFRDGMLCARRGIDGNRGMPQPPANMVSCEIGGYGKEPR